jgi:hypothetical protein
MGKKLVIDARMCGPRGHGIALYVEELAKGLNIPGWDLHFLLATDTPQDHSLRQFSHSVSTIPFLSTAEYFRLPQELAQLKPDRFLSPSFSALRHYPCPYGMVLHDLNHLHFGSFAKRPQCH